MKTNVDNKYVTAPTFGETLRYLMEDHGEGKGFTNEALAEAVRVSTEMISKYINDKARPSIDMLIKIAKALQLHPLATLSFAGLAGYDITLPTQLNKHIFDRIMAVTYE